MPSRDYYESLWEALPAGLTPAFFEQRLAFLLAHLRAGSDPSGRGPVGSDRAAPRVLDVGCGEARFTAALAEQGTEVVGVDVAEEPLRRARAARPDLALDLRLVPIAGVGGAHADDADPGPWPFEDASFDVVWAGEVIEHVADTAVWLSEVRRVLRPGGSLLLSTPAHDPLTRLRLALSARAWSAHFEPCGEHLRFYTRASLAGLLVEFGFEGVRVRGLGGVPGARGALLAQARRGRF